MNYSRPLQDEIALLDHYAAATLTGVLADPRVDAKEGETASDFQKRVARFCFNIAEAMIAERRRRMERVKK